ncbi:Fungalysin metallopeptidase-domain-containing protein [Vararia minispora EC-137]|uniref:Fungalysin metallopeptidase-domain-containing protein n=1 Tax=Vararia minispora EC-137 TaxID=1314806 RepID=A0ACB8Q8U7_9AGAM|nr:Fungalysin metallopeptidase-domain-containing protein [Vararia minispora EC-137]
MRLLTTTVALAGLAGCTLATNGHLSGRKSLGFGPVHPHAKFHSTRAVVTNNFLTTSDPLEIAREFVTDLLKDQLALENSFALRKDSYTDKATGVTHAYFRQIVNGVEVADGDINVNVDRNGLIISYGDSFYRGPAPNSFVEMPATTPGPHAEFCERLGEELQTAQVAFAQRFASGSGQVPLGGIVRHDEAIVALEHSFASNCEHVGTPFAMAQSPQFAGEQGVFDPRAPLLQFMIAATPNSEVVEDIKANWDKYVNGMPSMFEHHLIGEHNIMTEIIHDVPGAVSPVKAKPVYVQLPDGDKTTLMNAWRYEVEMADNWYEAVVSLQAPHRILSVTDWASDAPVPPKSEVHPPATYNVFSWGMNDPSEGNRSLAKENFDAFASPLGWHVIPTSNDPTYANVRMSRQFTNTTSTYGNNVFAHENWQGANQWLHNYRPVAGADMVFDYTYDPVLTNKTDALDEAKKYINATVTQLFYTVNMVHDLYYRYGFDEVSGNFQQHNFGRGGEENDAVIANAQDGSGYNNANFMTPPDGQNGRCRMYLWNTAMPYRDGDLEAGIVIHELSHGLSTRLTGGPANSGCLGFGEAGGMGEGWGDFLATMIRSKEEYSDFPMGAWAANTPKGIRNYPYSTNETVNPSTYKTLDGYWGVHAIGEVWAEMLWLVSHRLIAKHGFTADLFPPKPLADGTIPTGGFYRTPTPGAVDKPLVPQHGNSLAVQLVLNGMKLQPCRPGFFEARSAIIQADQVLTGGENFCEIWEAFASRGLGLDADVKGRTPWGGGVRTNGFEVPKVCKGEEDPEPTPDPKPEPGEPDDDDDDWPWSMFRKTWRTVKCVVTRC